MRVKAQKILVVEDDFSFRKAVKTLLEANGYRVVGVGGTVSVIKSIIKEKPDLILLDLSMPEVGGEEIIATMARMELKIPIVVVSGNINKLNLEILRGKGAVNFLVKPVEMTTLLAKVNDVLESGHSG